MKMKTNLPPGKSSAHRHSKAGSISFVFIALLGIMMILVTAESRALYQLHSEVKLLEQRQIKRINAPQTNAIAISLSGSK